VLPVDAGRGVAAEWPIVTTPGFARTAAAVGFCSGCLVGLCSGCFSGDAAALGLCSGCLVGFCSGCFTGAVAAAGFCSGWSTGTAAGKSGWCDVDVPISLGGRGGDTSPNIGENSGSVDAALERDPSPRSLGSSQMPPGRMHGPLHHRPRLRQGLGALVTASASECHERLA